MTVSEYNHFTENCHSDPFNLILVEENTILPIDEDWEESVLESYGDERLYFLEIQYMSPLLEHEIHECGFTDFFVEQELSFGSILDTIPRSMYHTSSSQIPEHIAIVFKLSYENSSDTWQGPGDWDFIVDCIGILGNNLIK
jgi:hypothetical protein